MKSNFGRAQGIILSDETHYLSEMINSCKIEEIKPKVSTVKKF